MPSPPFSCRKLLDALWHTREPGLSKQLRLGQVELSRDLMLSADNMRLGMERSVGPYATMIPIFTSTFLMGFEKSQEIESTLCKTGNDEEGIPHDNVNLPGDKEMAKQHPGE
ncbi:hypothetical protein SCUP515_06425 [Seiridium cupressi]